MMNRAIYGIFPAFVFFGIAGCSDAKTRAEQTGASPSPQCGSDARQVVEQLGKRMRMVSLLAPDSIVTRELRDSYGALVTPALLSLWQKSKATVPGRQVSNPWPNRIEINALTPGSDCQVEGDVVYVTTEDTTVEVERRKFVLQMKEDASGWRVNAFDWGNTRSAADNSVGAADVVRHYYEAIQAGKYDAAYALWAESGKASGKTPAGFARGFVQTQRTVASISDSVSVEAAAGSQYATVAVTVDATLRDGSRQHFIGTYTLRRSMVDGATPEQRSWRIYSAHLHQQ
jgi:hypothetical protein